MRLTFLGTAAAEAYPDAFCGCENCEAARSLGGPSLRKRSAAIINDDLLLDLGPDLLAASMIHGIPLTRVRYGLLTHEHGDHLDPMHFGARHDACGPNDPTHLDFYATEGALRVAASRLGSEMPPEGLADPAVAERLNVTIHPVSPFETWRVGSYRVSSFLANHGDGRIVPLLYVIEQTGRSVFYATDTGPLPEATWSALRDQGRQLDVVVMDHTFGFNEAPEGHLNRQQFLAQIERLQAERLLAEGVRVFAHHLGHHSNPPHPELAALAADSGYEVAYDGLTLDV